MEFAIIKGLGLGLILAISVGPIVFTILKLSLKLGHKAGYAYIIGVSFSDVLLAVLGNVAAELVRSALKYELYIGFGGAMLLLAMGVYSLFFGKDPVMDTTELVPDFRKKRSCKIWPAGIFHEYFKSRSYILLVDNLYRLRLFAFKRTDAFIWNCPGYRFSHRHIKSAPRRKYQELANSSDAS